MNDYRLRLNSRLRGMKPAPPPPPPWRLVAGHAVGGLTAIGYAPDSDLPLVISTHGRGLFDCLTGERLARDYESPNAAADWHDEIKLVAGGIGLLYGKQIPVAGPHGGGLPVATADGWKLEMIAPAWPDSDIILSPVRQTIMDEAHAEGCIKIAEDSEVRAHGFSQTGRSLAVAMSHTLTVFARGDA